MVAISLDHPLITPESINQAVVGERIGVHRAAVRKDPHDETAHYGLGVAYFNLGLLEESSDELAEAARLMPENPNIQFQLAVVYHDLSKRGDSSAEGKSLDRLRRALLLQPTLTDAHLLMAQIQYRKGEWAGMLTSLEKAAPSASDQVISILERFVSERKRTLYRLHEQIDRAYYRAEATTRLAQVPKEDSPPYRAIALGFVSLVSIFLIWTVLVNSSLRTMLNLDFNESLLLAFATFLFLLSLIVVPPMVWKRRRKTRRTNVVVPVTVTEPQRPTVTTLLSSAHELNRRVGIAERTLRS